MKKLLSEFNEFFEGKASAIINGGNLEITIDKSTLVISLPEPEVIGAQVQSMDLSEMS